MRDVRTLHDNTPVKAEFNLPKQDLPVDARVVIVGGGIAGASAAYHFAAGGWNDVIVLEQNQVASGTTWHSAGQVGQLRSSSAQTKVNKASAELYSRLKQETGHDPGWHQCGGLQLASCEERMLQLRRNAAMADVFGVEAEVVGANECRDCWPMLRTDDLVGGVYLPNDGRVLPGECTVALAQGAIKKGVKILEQVCVTSLVTKELRNGLKRICGVETDQGTIAADWVVLTGNMWMRQLAMTADVDVPVYPCEHHYVITRPIDGVTRDAPCTRDPDAGLYFRALDDGSLKLGAFKKRSKPWQVGDQVPNDFAFSLLEPDWPDFAEPFADHMHRLQGITREDVVKFVNGPEAFTPDNNFIMGQPHLTEGLFVLGGWNSAGIACAGGAGKYAVEWIENRGMTIDLCSVDVRRFLPFQNNRNYLQERVSEVLGLHYQMAWPGRQMETARGVRASGLYEIHKNNNACFGETAGWERPLFYAPLGELAKIDYSFGRQNWHQTVCREVEACRRNVAILDQSTFGKFDIRGNDALELLQWLCGANVDVADQTAVYTGMFNEYGTFESDLTIVRLGANHFYLVTATSQQVKDFDWIGRHIGARDVEIVDVTEETNVVSVMGPRAADVLRALDPHAFALEDHEYGTAIEFSFEGCRGLALRLSYVGEMGWELHVPTRSVAKCYRLIESLGASLGIRPIGNHAISAMRIEKGFRAYGHELSPEESPLQAGLEWTLDWSKDFLGKRELEKLRGQPMNKRLASFVLKDSESKAVLWGSEPITKNGMIVGHTTSACFSPTIGTSIALGYVRNRNGTSVSRKWLQDEFEIESNGKRWAAYAGLSSPLKLAERACNAAS